MYEKSHASFRSYSSTKSDQHTLDLVMTIGVFTELHLQYAPFHARSDSLNIEKLSALRISCGRLFHIMGASYLYLLYPNFICFTFETYRARCLLVGYFDGLSLNIYLA